MSSNSNSSNNNNNTDEQQQQNEQQQPQFRSIQIQQLQQPEASLLNTSASAFASAAAPKATDELYEEEEDSKLPAVWRPTELKSLPAFYPVEKSSRLIDEPVGIICQRLSEVFRKLSIQAIYHNDTALLVADKAVEMSIELWQAPDGVLVQVSRNKGDSLLYHGYATNILHAAVGLTVPDAKISPHSRKVQRMLDVHLQGDKQEHEHAVCAIEIAHGLLTKDRMDARVLGLESLCLLTDRRKTTLLTSVLTSHVVLLGSTAHVHIPGVEYQDESPFLEIQQSILSLVQFSQLSEEEEDHNIDHLSQLHNLALAVLANALACIETPELLEDVPERARTSSSQDVANEFLQDSLSLTKKELLATLITELSTAKSRPHDASLSAACISSLCKSSDDALRRSRELGAKEIVRSALDVGVRTHAKLEEQCETLRLVLEGQAVEENENGEEEDDNNEDQQQH